MDKLFDIHSCKIACAVMGSTFFFIAITILLFHGDFGPLAFEAIVATSIVATVCFLIALILANIQLKRAKGNLGKTKKELETSRFIQQGHIGDGCD